MKFEDLKLVQKWREYAGPKDERLEAENAKIYKIGFMLLSFGMLMILFYEILARQVAWVHSDASEMPHLFATPAEAAMYAWFVIVMLIWSLREFVWVDSTPPAPAGPASGPST